MLLWEDETVRTGSPLHQAKPGPYEFAIFGSMHTRLVLRFVTYLACLLREISFQFSPKGTKLKLTEPLSSKDRKI